MHLKFVLFGLLYMILLQTFAQKKVVAIFQSALTGVALPQGSRQDKRGMIEMSAKLLLQMESKKVNASIKIIEVLYLPAGFTSDSLVNQLTALGWNIIPVEADDKYVWLQKNGRSVLTYFFMNEKQTELYFGEAETPPNIAAVINNFRLNKTLNYFKIIYT